MGFCQAYTLSGRPRRLEKGRSLELVFGDDGMVVAIEDNVLGKGREIKLGSSWICFRGDPVAVIVLGLLAFWSRLKLVYRIKSEVSENLQGCSACIVRFGSMHTRAP